MHNSKPLYNCQFVKTAKFKSFLRYLQVFMQQHQIFPKSRKGWVAVSGGMDSMLLLLALSELKKQNKFLDLRAIHINHGSTGISYIPGNPLKSWQNLRMACLQLHYQQMGKGLDFIWPPRQIAGILFLRQVLYLM